MICYQEEISTRCLMTIKIFFRNHFRVARKNGRASQSMANTPSSSTYIKHEIRNMLESKLYIKVGKQCQSNSVSSTKEGLKALSHINKVCKVHLTLTTIRVHPWNPGTPPLLHLGLRLLLGLPTLHIILSQ